MTMVHESYNELGRHLLQPGQLLPSHLRILAGLGFRQALLQCRDHLVDISARRIYRGDTHVSDNPENRIVSVPHNRSWIVTLCTYPMRKYFTVRQLSELRWAIRS